MKSNTLLKRTIVAIWGIPIIFTTIYFGKYYFLALVLFINILSQNEFYKIAKEKNASPQKIIGISLGIILTLIIYFYGIDKIWIAAVPGTFLILLIELFRNKTNASLNFAVTVAGIVYPSLFFSFMILIRELPLHLNIPYFHGAIWVYIVFIAIWLCDTAAYFIGKFFGTHKLFSRISPKKTIEGAIAGFVFSITTTLLISVFYNQMLSFINLLIIGLIIGVFSQIGDLVESLFKRDAGIKDSSHLLPGHGGFLDRFDSPTFVAPIIFFYLKFFVF